jgi:hypothetical protein
MCTDLQESYQAGARLKRPFCERGFRPFRECLAAFGRNRDPARGFTGGLPEIEETSVR